MRVYETLVVGHSMSIDHARVTFLNASLEFHTHNVKEKYAGIYLLCNLDSIPPKGSKSTLIDPFKKFYLYT